MLHYLFTNDLRHERWPNILADSAELIHANKVPSATEDKSKNNYIKTQESYLCIHEGTKANLACREGQVEAVILNFINRFQFPNARTKDSFTHTRNDGMSIAPLRLAVQLLFVLNLIDKNQAAVSYDELVKYLICDTDVATGKAKNILKIATQLIQDRKNLIIPIHDPDTTQLASLGVEWKQCPRQIKELFSLLEFAPFIRCTPNGLSLQIPDGLDGVAAKQFFYIVNNRDMWIPPTHGDWEKIQKSYREYMDAGVESFKSSRISNIDILNTALECFRNKRATVKAPAGWDNFDAWAKAARSAFDDVDETKAADPNFDYAKFMREFAISVQVANTKFAGHSANEKAAVLKFLHDQKVNPQVVTWYLDGTHRPKINGEDVKGMGVTATLFFLMEIHPDLYASWSEMAYDSLSKVGLHNGPAPTKLTLQSYDDCKAKQCQVLTKMNEMGIGKAADDPSDADYITANEFLWFVSEQYDLIMKEWSKHMKKEIKPEDQKPIDISKFEDFIKAFHKASEDAGLTYDLALVKRFVCALLAKPFVVLTGLSGSGKTKLAQAFTQWIALSETARIVPVGADWANNEKLLGYPNGLDPNNYILPDTGVLKLMIDANDNPTVPFFLILDEMNLSHVERYFADFLSAMESNGSIKLYDGKNRTADDGTPVPPTIPFPKNLFVIGTMNVDETTHMFSPKVLDRAQVIEFRVTAEQMADYLDKPKKLDMTQVDGKGLQFAQAFLDLHNTPAELEGNDKKTVSDALKQFFPTLAELGSEFAFRTASEAKLFCAFARKANLSVEESVDAAIMQKLLPKLHGSRRRLALPLEAFWEFCRMDGKTESLGDLCKKDAAVKVTDVAKYKVSAEKIKLLYKAAETNGFASYAEA